MDKISVIIPVYNTREYVGACLDSVLCQSVSDLECIVVDDCSTDGAMSVVQKYTDNRIKMLRHTINRGLSAARNTGVQQASGEWIFFLDSDDTLPQDALKALLEAASGDTDWVQGAMHRVSQSSSHTTTYPAGKYTSHTEIAANYARLNFTNSTNKLIRSSFCRRLSFVEGLIFEDSLWCAQAYTIVKSIAVVEFATYNHNIRQGSIMTSSFSERKIESLLYIVESMMALEPDSNLQHTAVFNALYLVKNLYLHNFSTKYRRYIMSRLRASDVFMMSMGRNALPPFTRLLSYGRRLPDCWFWAACRLYALVNSKNKPRI